MWVASLESSDIYSATFLSCSRDANIPLDVTVETSLLMPKSVPLSIFSCDFMQSAKTSWIRFSTLARSPHGVTAYSDAMGEWPKNVASFIVYIQLFLA